MAGFTATVRLPRVTLREQVDRIGENYRGKPMPLQWFTSNGHKLKAAQVVGKPLAEIRLAAFALDALKGTRNLNSIPDIPIKRQLARFPLKQKGKQGKCLTFDLVTSMGYRLRAEEVLGHPLSVIETLSARVNAQRALNTEEILWTPLPAMEKLTDRIKGIRFPLENFGKMVKVTAEQKTWEVVIGLEVEKLEEQGIKLEETVGRSLWAVTNRNGVLSNISMREARAVVDAINEKFGLGVDLLDEEVSEIVSKKFVHQLLGHGIFWYHDAEGQRVISNVYVRGIDPIDHPQLGGLLIGRPKP